MDKETLNYWKTVITFLHDVLGDNYEIILHVIDKNDIYIGELVNSHISGRSKQSPLTTFALDLITNKVYKEKDFVTNYKAIVSPQHKEVRGSTFFIKDKKGNLEGMLCINLDISAYQGVARDLLKLVNLNLEHFIPTAKEPKAVTPQPEEAVEILTSNIQDIIGQIIDPSLLRHNVHLSQDVKIDIVAKLYEKGVFQLKGAVSKVADILCISEPSVYRYLKKIEADQ
ncbi:TPA: transcriptional regulator [Streptococcus pyogenes]|uniref:helix-turn-helix transcriptional regulator n=1 Tax=Streptococcus pyogenes TaxID=1314 RepID=UPI00109BFC56|nr:transcriptional regulator [Streptococcus pyogenes]VGV46067.1 sensory box protein [Streptococcus pyogenes]VGV78667.1 sensory box protein [Streptococcus pyogenes]VHA84586.1 sensory box protein [Streptococcus pyogenes]VHE67164.1 sensory box protein [Streptococcus pyogenes]HEP1538021.1 transcriptional regulator [Streptococcus pyogenes]